MAKEEVVASGVTDPLSELIGPSLFPRTFRDSVGVLSLSGLKDPDDIHSVMKSLEWRSPEKLMSEARRIVDGGPELLNSIVSENVATDDATRAKVKGKPQERRPGLGLVRKRVPFSLKTNISQPTVICKNNVSLDSIDDPDEYFDTYERMEKANKEIQKQMGGNVDKFSLYKPSNNERRRRQGILGKTYTYKHRFPKDPSENDDTLVSPEASSQTVVAEDVPRSHEDHSQNVVEKDILSSLEDTPEKVVEEDILDPSQDPNPDSIVEEAELAGPMKTTDGEYSDILQDVLSFNIEDLKGLGALNLLQERLNIKPLDIENLGMAERLDFGRGTSISTLFGSFQKSESYLPGTISAHKNLNKMPTMKHKQLSTPTPPRSPFCSISLLKKKISHPDPLRDPFSPTDVDLSESPNASAAQLEDKLSDQVDAVDDLDMSNELESHVNIVNTEPLVHNVNAREDQVNSNGPTKSLVDDDADLQNSPEDMPLEDPGNDFDTRTNVNANESNPSVIGEEARDDMPSSQQTEQEQLEAHNAKGPRRTRVAGEKRIRKLHPMRKSLADAGTSFEDGVRRSKRVKMRALEYWKGERFLYGRVDDSLKLIGVKYISPGKGNENLKVRPYVLSESSKLKELLEMEAGHYY